ncbi:MAG TPA: response regulator [Stenotrophomonas sp.]
MKQATGRDTAIGVTAFALALGTIGIESITPLGYAVWLLYFMAVCVTVFQNRPMLPLAVAALSCLLLAVGYKIAPPSNNSAFSFVNRSIGGTCFILTALVVMQAIRARREAERALWLQEGANAVSVSLHGDLAPNELAESALGVLCGYIGAQVGALYRLDGERLALAGGVALSPDVPRELPVREGQLGETLRLGQARRVHGVATTHLPIASALGRSAPGELLMAPVSADGNWMGVVELGRVASSLHDGTAIELLARCGEIIGVALRTSLLRGELLDLLEETQRQSEELQAQQEELRVANEELEEQSRSLQHSQASLEQQQAELEQTNVQLEERTHELEGQRQRLLNAQSELVRNSQELATASRYKSEFLANMSHELRTPLNSSLILAKLLADNRDGTLTAEQVKYAQAIHSSNNDLLALINDILDLSKIEAGHIELADDTLQTDSLLMRLRETFEPLARQKGLALDIATDPGAPTQFIADNQRLQQILKNLLANALKFTEHGSVSLKVQAHGPRRMRFVVCDTGIGIARDQTEVIFEAFRQADGSTRRRFGGTGLGLSISRDLALRMGGAISVESEPGRGSCFTLELPVDGAPAEAADMPLPAPAKPVPSSTLAERLPTAPPTPVVRAAPTALPTESVEDDRHRRSRPGRLILAVEDDVDFARALVALAHDLDFDCVVAPTAEQALALAAELRPSGILLDIGLPDVSGLSVLERLKRDPATRHIPVHVVSAVERTQVALELGAVGFLIKPATRERLASAIEQLEQTSARAMRRLLIVEDDQELRENLQLLLARDQLEIIAVGTIAEAIEQLVGATFDCMVTDLALPDGSGYDLLERMAGHDAVAFPPVIVYTGRALTRDEEQRLRRYSKSIIIKGARSPERLLDEVTLFLHSVEASLPSQQQRLLREARRRDAVLDGRTVLLAEDDVRNIFALSSVLEPLGVTLEIARNGREALERLAVHDVDLILMDIMMPEMDGLTAMREIRRNPAWQNLPIIALTAKAMADDREHCLEAGANDYIAKPIDVDKLVSLCRVWCARQ